MDNLSSCKDSDHPHFPANSSTSSPPLAPLSLPRRHDRVVGEKLAAEADVMYVDNTVDHVIIFVHGAGTSKEAAEKTGADLQVRCEV
jgi:hypothetical protein